MLAYRVNDVQSAMMTEESNSNAKSVEALPCGQSENPIVGLG
jgi:hypothetical protein